ncbi:MAG: hypothetical protein OEM03_01750 [Chromatiales bacterium]|nr:hypothetical protein [Chromatiales bacterium]
MIDDRIEDFEDDEFVDDQEIEVVKQDSVVAKPLAGVRKTSPWKSVEEYMEERRLKISLSEDNYDYDI